MRRLEALRSGRRASGLVAGLGIVARRHLAVTPVEPALFGDRPDHEARLRHRIVGRAHLRHAPQAVLEPGPAEVWYVWDLHDGHRVEPHNRRWLCRLDWQRAVEAALDLMIYLRERYGEKLTLDQIPARGLRPALPPR